MEKESWLAVVELVVAFKDADTASSGIFGNVLERTGCMESEVDCNVAKGGKDGMGEASVPLCDNRTGVEVIHC